MGNGILVFVETDGGKPRKSAFELLTKAFELNAGAVSAVVVGDLDASALPYGITVYQASGADFVDYTTGVWAAALTAAVKAADPAVVLASASASARDALPRVAARLGAGLGVEVTDLRSEGGKLVGRRPVYGGKALTDVKSTAALSIFTVRPNSFPAAAAPGGSPSVVALSVALSETDKSVKLVERLAPSSKTVDLTEAERIVSGGRSLGDKAKFDAVIRPLAATVSATVGASRAAVDAGFAGHSEQVGQTGKTVNPTLYIALGISGAIQHLAGMRTSRVIVAVNKDAEAPIFQHATYGVVGDLFEFAPALQKELAAALA